MTCCTGRTAPSSPEGLKEAFREAGWIRASRWRPLRLGGDGLRPGLGLHVIGHKKVAVYDGS